MREGTVVRWYKQEGETVDRGEVIADIETDKATVEFEAYTGGVIGRIVAQEGVAVPVGNLIAIITEPGEDVPEMAAAPAASAPAPAPAASAAPAPAPAPEPAPAAAPAPASADGQVRASPIARRLARERGIDIALVAGTGPNGRITERDIESYQPGAAEPAAAPRASPRSGSGSATPSQRRTTLASNSAGCDRPSPA